MRTLWYYKDLDEPKNTKKFAYRQNVIRCTTDGKLVTSEKFEAKNGLYAYRAEPIFKPRVPNLVGSKIPDSRQHAPIIDIDIDHLFVESTTVGHSHLFLNVEIAFWRYVILMFGLCIGKTVDWRNFFYLLRDRQSFVRVPGLKKPEKAAKSGKS